MSNIERWIAKFKTFGAQPSPDRYVDLFDPEGTVFDSGMERPIGVCEIPTHMEMILTLIPDLSIAVTRWRANGDTVFVEARNSATLAGENLEGEAVYCVTLRGDRVLRGRRYYDRAQLFSRINPALPQLPAYVPVVDHELEEATDWQALGNGIETEEFLERYTKLWQTPVPRRFAAFYHPQGQMLNPGMARPIRRAEIPGYYAFLLSLIPDLRMERMAWAGDQRLLFVEWRGTGTFADQHLMIDVMDRFEFVDGRIAYGRAYFDTLAILSLIGPSLRSVSFATPVGTS